MKTVILAGGLGTRLRPVTGDPPKALALVGDQPIIEHQIAWLAREGLRHITIATSYQAEKIKNYCGNGQHWNTHIRYSHENNPLGTAGAIRQATRGWSDDFLVISGDLLIDMDLAPLIQRHFQHQPLATIVVHPNDHPHDSDLVEIDAQGQVTRWLSKINRSPGYYANLVNASVQICSPALWSHYVDRDWSWEKDTLNRAITQGGKILTYRTSEYIKDIGTPERLSQANQHYRQNLVAQRSFALNRCQRAIFLDRDGTINENRPEEFITSPDQFKLRPGAASAIAKINSSGYLAICVTNQSVIARNLCDWPTLRAIHNKMETLLGEAGAYLDDIYLCPHHPDRGYPEERVEYKINCSCRKPKIGLILEAQKRYRLDLSQCHLIGDSPADQSAAQGAGLKFFSAKGDDGLSWAVKTILN